MSMYTWFVDTCSAVSVHISLCNCLTRLDNGSTGAKHVGD